MLFGWTCFVDGISYGRMCITGRDVLQENRSYQWVYPIGGHVLQEDMSYWRSYFKVECV